MEGRDRPRFPAVRAAKLLEDFVEPIALAELGHLRVQAMDTASGDVSKCSVPSGRSKGAVAKFENGVLVE
jgi:hypothetical protein